MHNAAIAIFRDQVKNYAKIIINIIIIAVQSWNSVND